MSDLPLVAFTLLLQAAVGTALAAGMLGHPQAALAWPLAAGLALLGVLASCAHLGAPARAWRAVRHWRSSWLSREVLAAGAFTLAAGAAALTGAPWARGAALVLGPALVLAMAQAYRLGPVPAWNTPLTPLAFLASTLLLGALAGGALLGAAPAPLWLAVAAAAALQLVLARRWRTPEHQPLHRGRLALGGLGLGAALLAAAFPDLGALRLAAAAALAGGEVLGRVLFYAARVPHGVYRHPG